MKITRRHVLAATAALTGAAALGVGTTAWRWWDRPPGAGLKTLSQDEHDFMQALAEAWMPAGGEPALSGSDAQLGLFMDDLLTAVSPLNQSLLKLLMQALDDWPLPTSFSSFRGLDLASRQETLRGWLHHDHYLMRSAIQGLVVLMSIGWTTHPDVSPIFQRSMNCWYGR